MNIEAGRLHNLPNKEQRNYRVIDNRISSDIPAEVEFMGDTLMPWLTIMSGRDRVGTQTGKVMEIELFPGEVNYVKDEMKGAGFRESTDRTAALSRILRRSNS